MIDRLRPVWLAITAGLLVVLNLGSVAAQLRGEGRDWSAKVDRPPIAMLWLVLAIAGIALAVTRRKA